jgi:hypothetical protein
MIGTRDFGTTLTDFRRAWAAVRVPMSQSRPVRVMRSAAAVAGDVGGRLVAACRALAAENRGGTFFLSARTAGATLGVSKSHAANMLKALVAAGRLERVRVGTRSRVRRQATVYRIPEGAS